MCNKHAGCRKVRASYSVELGSSGKREVIRSQSTVLNTHTYDNKLIN